MKSASLAHADREYVRVLHLAAPLSVAEVETALELLEEGYQVPTASMVRVLVHPVVVQPLTTVSINLQPKEVRR